MILAMIAAIVAEILCCCWSIFFQWYRRKREREAGDFLNKLEFFSAG